MHHQHHHRTIDTDRDTEMQSNKRTSRKQLKTIDYSDISLSMLKAQQQQVKGKRKAAENEFDDLPVGDPSRFSSIDTKFKQEIDMMRARERKNNAQLPPNIGQSYEQTPK